MLRTIQSSGGQFLRRPHGFARPGSGAKRLIELRYESRTTLAASGHSATVRAIRLFLAAGIMAGGLGAAWPFRHRPTAPLPPRDASRVDVPLRRPDIVIHATPVSTVSPASGLDDAGEAVDRASGPPAARPDWGALAPPPAMPQDFGPSPATEPAGDSRHWQPVRMKLSAGSRAARRHRLTDGDSLENLAERYLCDSARADEIFELNRDVLAAPDLLPLGRIIRIPGQ